MVFQGAVGETEKRFCGINPSCDVRLPILSPKSILQDSTTSLRSDCVSFFPKIYSFLILATDTGALTLPSLVATETETTMETITETETSTTTEVGSPFQTLPIHLNSSSKSHRLALDDTVRS